MKRSRTKNKKTYVELFCGCGGMSLGLGNAGFECLLANDVSPMAAETFAYNLVKGASEGTPPSPANLGGDYFNFLVEPSYENSSQSDWKTFRDWKSYPKEAEKITLAAKEQIISGGDKKLLVGDAGLLSKLISELKPSRLEGVDLLAGGPPCQSFSLAGKREKNNPRNQLFTSFVSVAEALKPKVILFENVLGITSPFRGELGKKYHPWFEVCKAFRLAGYVPIPSLVNASQFGVPQSRSRFIMIALREDIARSYLSESSCLSPLANALELGLSNYGRRLEWKSGDDRRLIFRPEGASSEWPELLFPQLSNQGPISVGKAIGDIKATGENVRFRPSAYSKKLNDLLRCGFEVKDESRARNHNSRRHGNRTSARFRLMRLLAENGWNAKSMAEVVANKERVFKDLYGKELLSPDSSETILVTKNNRKAVYALVEQLASAKHMQRCLDKSRLAPAQLSIPDDFIHWADDRVLTIREMARIQSFPDWFIFRSKETTGGDGRAFEVPQYTQVGNAVPPLLSKSFGNSIKNFLEMM